MRNPLLFLLTLSVAIEAFPAVRPSHKSSFSRPFRIGLNLDGLHRKDNVGTAGSSTTQLQALFRRGVASVDSYAERRRKLRRDYYTHENWLRARSKNRFTGTIAKMIESGVVRQLYDEVLSIGILSTLVCLWNLVCVTGWEGIRRKYHAPLFHHLPLVKLPLEPFTISASALSLLLGK